MPLGDLVTRLERGLPAHRELAITFDDAYADFEASALPLLQKYVFGAALFVVTSHVGGQNAWDAAYGEAVRLMDWPAIRLAADAGIEIGAHSATHPPLTGLPPADIVAEAMGGWFVLGAANAVRDAIARTLDACHVEDHVRDQSSHEHIKACVQALEAIRAIKARGTPAPARTRTWRRARTASRSAATRAPTRFR